MCTVTVIGVRDQNDSFRSDSDRSMPVEDPEREVPEFAA